MVIHLKWIIVCFLISSSTTSTWKHQDFQHHRLHSHDLLDNLGWLFYIFNYHPLQDSGQEWRPAHWCEDQKCHHHPVSAQGPGASNSVPGGHFCREQHRVKQPNLFSRTDNSLRVSRLVEQIGIYIGLFLKSIRKAPLSLEIYPVFVSCDIIHLSWHTSPSLDRSLKWKCPWEGDPVAPFSINKPQTKLARQHSLCSNRSSEEYEFDSVEKEQRGICLVGSGLCGASADGSKHHTPFFLRIRFSFSLGDTMLFWVLFYFSDPGYSVCMSTTNLHPGQSKLFEIEIPQIAKHALTSVCDW